MKKHPIAIISFVSISLLFGSGESASRLLAAASDPAMLKAKGEAEKQEYTFLAGNDELIAGAKKEGKLRVASQFDPRTNKAWISAFKKRYPFMTDVHVEDATGTDPQQRFLLELKAGRPTGWDVYDIAPDFHAEYLPYIKKFDISRIASAKMLAIPAAMIDPKNGTR